MLLLDHVKACNAGFLHAIPGVLHRRLAKGVNKLGFDVHVYVDDEHFGRSFLH
jgi:hypothetical protein